MLQNNESFEDLLIKMTLYLLLDFFKKKQQLN